MSLDKEETKSLDHSENTPRHNNSSVQKIKCTCKIATGRTSYIPNSSTKSFQEQKLRRVLRRKSMQKKRGARRKEQNGKDQEQKAAKKEQETKSVRKTS